MWLQDNMTQPPTAYGGPFNVLNQPSDSGTTHMSIVDGTTLFFFRCNPLKGSALYNAAVHDISW